MYISYYDSLVGKITLLSDGVSLTNLAIDGQELSDITNVIKSDSLEVFKKAKKWLDIYFKGEDPGDFSVPLLVRGTEFQKEVWNILLSIKYGETISYSDIAKIIAKKRNIKRMSSQAVGHAIGKNPIAIIIPCHRVIGKNGKLIGYNGGIDIKKRLLELEKGSFFHVII